MLQKHPPDSTIQGFTLVELSIVLVIIGLLVGGILVGRDLINAASIRAQITQLQQYQTAVKTFRLKYNAIPGDLTNDTASQLGFWTPRGTGAQTNSPASNLAFADGDGNGVLEGYCSFEGGSLFGGETSMFWNDLGMSGLIAGRFPNNTDAQILTSDNGGPLPLSSYLPQAAIGNANYVYVWSGGFGLDYGGSNGGTGENTSPLLCGSQGGVDDDTNYFTISQMPGGIWYGGYVSLPGITVTQAYSIDTKIDDGLPQSGTVTAMYPSQDGDGYVMWSERVWDPDGNNWWDSAPAISNPTPATQGDTTTCYDNNNTLGKPQHYSTEVNGGNLFNCALSFKFQ